MKSKTEINLDKEFEKLGIRPAVYHYTNVPFFNGITIADTFGLSWKGGNFLITKITKAIANSLVYKNKATQTLEYLQKDGTCGVAICDKRDQFNRRRGRIIAKGRLLKHLKENKNDK